MNLNYTKSSEVQELLDANLTNTTQEEIDNMVAKWIAKIYFVECSIASDYVALPPETHEEELLRIHLLNKMTQYSDIHFKTLSSAIDTFIDPDMIGYYPSNIYRYIDKLINEAPKDLEERHHKDLLWYKELCKRVLNDLKQSIAQTF